jgi:hypothetical protein
VGPRTGLDAEAKRKNPFPCFCRESKPDRPACSLITTLIDLVIALCIKLLSSNETAKDIERFMHYSTGYVCLAITPDTEKRRKLTEGLLIYGKTMRN